MKTLYVTDLDGTLLTSEKNVCEYTVQIINALVEKGMCFTYATARSFSSSYKLVNDICFQTPIVAYNGAQIVAPQTGEVVAIESFTSEEVYWVKTILEKHNISPTVYSFVDGRERVSWVKGTETSGVKKYIEARTGDKRLRGLMTNEQLYAGDVFYFGCIGEKRLFEDAYKEIVQDERYTCTLQAEPYDKNEYWLEIMPRKATKANAILKLKEILGCDRVVSFGDALNDIPMFQISDECYAMENAVDKLKEMATGVIASNNEDGVAKWLAKHVR